MNTVLKSLSIAALMSIPAATAFAAAHEMDYSKTTCAEYMAMDEEGQMTAVDGMTLAKAKADGTAAADATATTEKTDEEKAKMTEDMAAMATGCEGNDDMLTMDVMNDMAN